MLREACRLGRADGIRRAALFAAIAAGGALAPESAAAQRPAPAPTLDSVVAFALRHNVDLQTARLRVDSALAERRIAAAYPNPTISATPGNPSQYGATVPLDVGPGRTLRTRAAHQGQTAAAFDSADARRQVVFSTRQAFYDLLLADALAALTRRQRGIFRDLLTADSVRLRSGDIPALDVARSELELARADARLQRAEAGVRGARVALQVVMGVPDPDTAFTVTGSLHFRSVVASDDSLAVLAQRSRPDLLAAATRVRQSETLRGLATAQLIPMPAMSAVYQPAQPFASGKHVAVGVGVQIPLWNLYGGERQRARLGVAIAREGQRRAAAQVTADVAAAADAFAASRTFARSYEGNLLARATENLAAAQYAYRSGATSLVDLLSAISSYIDINTEYLTAVHDYWVSAYALDRAVGADVIHEP